MRTWLGVFSLSSCLASSSRLLSLLSFIPQIGSATMFLYTKGWSVTVKEWTRNHIQNPCLDSRASEIFSVMRSHKVAAAGMRRDDHAGELEE